MACAARAELATRTGARAWRGCLAAALFLASTLSAAASAAAAAPETIDAFVRAGCPHCALAEAHLVALDAARPDLEVRFHDVVEDPAARRRLFELTPPDARPAVPTLIVRGTVLVGWDPERTPARIAALLDAPSAAPAVPAGAPDEVALPLLGRITVGELGLPLFTLAIGAVDGFNPCATWVLLFLLALLVNLKDRRRMALVAGTFVAVSGLAYYAFMAAWLNLFLLVGLSRGVQLALGALALAAGAFHLKDAVAPAVGPSLAIPERAKPGIQARIRAILLAEDLASALATAATLAVMVNLVELLCTAGLPAVYTQILTARDLPLWQYHAYLGLYLLAYMADDLLLLAIALVTLRRTRLSAAGGRALQAVSGLTLALLGALLMLRPGWLV